MTLNVACEGRCRKGGGLGLGLGREKREREKGEGSYKGSPHQLPLSLIPFLPSPPKVVEQDLRPISLTPHIAKVVEGLTLDSLFKQVCDKLDTHQFALAGKSTTHALVYFLQVILEALDQRDTYARIFFTDFSKGFDLVDHNILIQEMELLGVREPLSDGSARF